MYNNTTSESESESSEEHSSSECSTDSSDDDKLETVQLNHSRVPLPQGLCEKKDIFQEFFARSWSALGESSRQHLRQFLPKFLENQEKEQNVTLQRLLSGENFKFSSPLDNFYEHLKSGHYRPDIAKMRYLIRKAERKESLWRHRKFKERLQAEILESRKSLLRQVNTLPPGVEPRLQKPSPTTSTKTQNPIYNRTKRRYFDILASIKGKVDESGFSSDDNYPEGAPSAVSRKDKRILNTIKNSQVLNGEKVVISTLASKPVGFDLEKNVQPNHNPYIITEKYYRNILQEHRKRKFDNAIITHDCMKDKDISISDVIKRAKVNYNKREKLIKPEVVQKPAKKKIKREPVVVERVSYSSELNFSSDSDSDSITTLPMNDFQALPAISSISTIVPVPVSIPSKPPPVVTAVTVAPPILKPPTPIPRPITPIIKSEAKKKIKTEPKTVPQISQPIKTKVMIKQEPVQVAPSIVPSMPAPLPLPKPISISVPTPLVVPTLLPPPPLQQIKIEEIEIKTEEVEIEPIQTEYITPATLSDLEGIDMMKLPIDLQDSNIDIMEISTKVELMQDTHANFLALIRDVICSTPEHRMDMRMLENKLKSWQENPITALNDWYSCTDNWLLDLQSAVNFLSGNFPEQPDEFVPYIEYKPSLNKYQWIGAGRDSDVLLNPLFQYWLDHKSEMKPVISIKEKEDDKEEIDLELDRSMTPPPPRCPTDWQVRKADPDDVKIFREQERLRYDNPHKSFTYRCNGYESVVGPLKGIYSPSSSNTKARGHTMLSADRPNFVTILSLVRDATARLPNGEGTRAEICELLKCSQYISNIAPDSLLQSVVSGALDRMHTQFDPCVKYDPKRKIWIYLHRNRSEEDFERIHQQYQGMNKTTKKKKSPAKPKAPKEKKNNTNANVTTNVTSAAGNKTNVVVQVQVTNANSNSNQSLVEETRPVKEKQPKQSLLINQNHNQHLNLSPVTMNSVTMTQSQSLLNTNIIKMEKDVEVKIEDDANDKEISQALQSITQPQQVQIHQQSQSQSQPQLQQLQLPTTTAQPQVQTTQIQTHQLVQVVQAPHKQVSKAGKSLVKIITSNQGAKSLIIPSTANTIIKQDNRSINVIATSTAKVATPLVTQQLLQSFAQQKQHQHHQHPHQQLIRVEIPDQKEPLSTNSKKANLSIQQQILQSISPQQLQNIKNVTLLRNVRQNQGIVLTHNEDAGEESVELQQATPIRVQQGTLTLAQQQQLLQTIRQKGLAQMGQQQVLFRHKAPVLQKTAPGTSLLGQTRVITDNSGNKAQNQGPIVAKVLTNAAGQVISVESLLAHQKQHGTLPQGTTLRVSGVKAGTNIIQLGGPQNKTSQAHTVAQVVASQNNFITLQQTSQPKLVLSSTTTTNAITTVTGVTATKPITKTVSKTQTISKFPPKVAQQIINAKFITQNIDGHGQKLVQPKVIIGQNQIKLGNKAKPINIQQANANSLRMVNASNINLAHLGGKPLLLASKGSTLQNIQGQNVIIQTQANSTNSLLTMQGNKISSANTSTMNVISQGGQQVVLAPQIKMQPQMLLSSNMKNSNLIQNQGTTNQIIVGGHPVRLATTSAGNAQRVVLASQGQGGQLVAQQILLPAGFQGTAINIKSLQGVKVIPIAQQTKGIQGRQVFARVMNPASIVRTATVSAADVQQTTPTSE